MCIELVPQEGISLDGGKEGSVADGGESSSGAAKVDTAQQPETSQGRKTIYRISNSQRAETTCKGAATKEKDFRSLSNL